MADRPQPYRHEYPRINPMERLYELAMGARPTLLSEGSDALKGLVASAAGFVSDMASMPLAAYASGFSMGNGQYPGKVMGELPFGSRDFGRRMGANVDSTGFMLGEIGSPDPHDAAVLAPKLAAKVGFDKLAALAGMTAWHGGPHKFDKFDMSKIGTGEGAQAYGHGLYFAESKDVARRYAIDLANRVATNQGRLNAHANAQRLVNLAGDPKPAADDIKFALDADPSNDQKELLTETLEFIESGEYKKPLANNGTLYEVDIPDDAIAKMLDWDKPLSEQSESVRKALEPMVRERNLPESTTGEMLYAWLATGHGSKGAKNIEEAASAELNALGVPGIRYLDGSSRSAGEGTRNFVVFDDTLPKVVSRNGEKLKK